MCNNALQCSLGFAVTWFVYTLKLLKLYRFKSVQNLLSCFDLNFFSISF